MDITNLVLVGLAIVHPAIASSNGNGTSGQALQDGDEFWKFPTCTLQCQNGGSCNFVKGKADELAKKAQSGELIEECICKDGYSGLTCQIPCIDKGTSIGNGTSQWECDDSIFAKSLSSEYAGTTEYCSGEVFNIHTLPQFCTNGGRCRADFLGAEADPGNTTVNRNFQFEGCICPKEFHGPHCELLRVNNAIDDIGGESDFEGTLESVGGPRTKKGSQTISNPGKALLFSLLSLTLLAVAVTALFSTRRNDKEPVTNGVEGFLETGTPNVGTVTPFQHFHRYIYNVVFDEGIILPDTEMQQEIVFEESEFV
jgi:hypothetical protein